MTVSEFDKIRRPNNFFLTFENIRARQQLINQKKFDFAGHKITIKEPSDPSDIQWANFGVSNANRCSRIIFFIVLCVVIMGIPIVSSFVVLMDWIMLVNYLITIPNLNCDKVE